MNAFLFCVLSLLIRSTSVVQKCSAEEEKKEKTCTLLQNAQIKQTIHTPYYTCENSFLGSPVNDDYVVNSYADTVASTSNDPRFLMSWTESSINPDFRETTDGSEISSAGNNMDYIESDMQDTTCTILTNKNITRNTELINLQENISHNSFEQCEFTNIQDPPEKILNNIHETSESSISQNNTSKMICTVHHTNPSDNTLNDTLKSIVEYLHRDNGNKQAYCMQHLKAPLYTLDEVLETIEEDLLKNNANRTCNDSTTIVTCVETTKNENDKLSHDENTNNNKNKDIANIVKIWKKDLLTVHQKEIYNTIRMLKYINKIMIECSIFNKELCSNGLNLILRASKMFQKKPSLSIRPSLIDFFKYIKTVHEALPYYIFSENSNSSSNILNSFYMYSLCLFLMFMPPLQYGNVKYYQKRKIRSRKKLFNLDICSYISSLASKEKCDSLCNRLKISALSSKKIADISAFNHVLFLPRENEEFNTLEELTLKYFEKTLIITQKYQNVINSWVKQHDNHVTDCEIMMSKMNSIKSEAQDFKLLMEYLLNTISEHITTHLKSVSDVTTFSIYSFGMLLMECTNTKTEVSVRHVLSFIIFQKFLKACERNMSLEDMMKLENHLFFIKHVGVLSYFFMYTYVRVCQVIVFTIIKNVTTICNELEKIEKSGFCYVEKKFFLANIKYRKILDSIYRHTTVLRKININRRNMHYIQSSQNLIDKINTVAETLKSKAKIYKSLQNDKNKIILKEHYEEIRGLFKKLCCLFSEDGENGEGGEDGEDNIDK